MENFDTGVGEVPPIHPGTHPMASNNGQSSYIPSTAINAILGSRLGKLLNKPEEYDGKDRSKCNTFVAQVQLYISGNFETFPNEESKVLFAATYLRDKAFVWFEPYMGRPNDPILSDFTLFCQTLLSAFGDPELKKTMMRKIKLLKQTSSASNYRTEFENYAQYLNFGEAALREYFYDGLKDSIKDTIAEVPGELEPTSFDDFKAWCVRIDSRLHDRKMDGKGDARPV